MKVILRLSAIALFFSLSAKATPTAKVGMQTMVKAYFATQSSAKFTVTKKDLNNGYMEYKVAYTAHQRSKGELAYYVTSSGQEILAVTTLACMQACGTMLQFYGMRNGKLTMLPNQVVGMTMDALSDAIFKQVQAKMSANEKQRQANGEMALFDQITTLPQQGTTIYIKKDSRVDRNIVVVAELRFNLTTGKFSFVKR